MTISIAAEAPLSAPAADCGPALLSVSEACARASAYAAPLMGTGIVPVTQAAGRTLAEPVVARIAAPPFTQSAMDGYALAAGEGMTSGTRLEVVGRVPAGSRGGRITAGQAVRLFTGAPLPEGANAVIMQEHAQRDGDSIVLHRALRASRARPTDLEDDPLTRHPGQSGILSFAPGLRPDDPRDHAGPRNPRSPHPMLRKAYTQPHPFT